MSDRKVLIVGILMCLTSFTFMVVLIFMLAWSLCGQHAR